MVVFPKQFQEIQFELISSWKNKLFPSREEEKAKKAQLMIQFRPNVTFN